MYELNTPTLVATEGYNGDNKGPSQNWISFELLNVNQNEIKRLRPVTALDTYVGATKNLHPEGLYSTETFGILGSDERFNKFGYIDLGIEIISPVVAHALFDLKRLYKEILSGSRHAVWDAEECDFFSASPEDDGANTGYSFFMAHYHELKPKETDSLIRQQNIDVFNAFRDIAMSRYVLVLPAGYREIEIKDAAAGGGKEQEDDINPMYRKLITTSKSIPPRSAGRNSPLLDSVRWNLQKTFLDIYEYLFTGLDGKQGRLRGKWTKRNIQNGTRNVISSMDASSEVMGREDAMRPTDTEMGLYQGIKSLLPVAIHAIRTRYLPEVDAGNGSLYLINPKTLKREMVSVKPENYDLVTTDEGIEELINKFKVRDKRHKSFTVEGMYVALIYDDGECFKVFYDINDLPEERDKKYVTGITITELLYLSGYDKWNDYFTIVTRYPVTGEGSTYSSTIRLTTTSTSSMRYELLDDWKSQYDKPAICFPDKSNNEFVTSMAPHPSRLEGLGADFDGDTASGDAPYTVDALEENKKMINSVSYWLTPNGELNLDVGVETIERVATMLLKD